jgi:hypothetical protein
VLEQLDGEAPVREPELLGAVGGHGAVQADDGVQVHQAAALVLGDLDVGDPDELAQSRLRHPSSAARVRGR